MSEAAANPYAVLGVAPGVSDIELRRAYRELVKRHHPDHNGGSTESAHRFAQIQNAYAAITRLRRAGGAQPARPAAAQRPPAAAQGQPAAATDPAVEDRIAALERELAAAREAERRRAELLRNQPPRATNQPPRPTQEELGYYSTDDSFTKIIDDAAEQFGERLRKSDAKKQFTRRLSDLFARDD